MCRVTDMDTVLMMTSWVSAASFAQEGAHEEREKC
jgi:hypothetical protein